MLGHDRRVRKLVGVAVAAFLGLALTPLVGTAAFAQESCVTHAIEAEKKFNIPSGLLLAIALVESGQDGSPHPFAMSVNGRAVFARDTRDAARHLKDRSGEVRGNVYVGCMQLSLSVHRGQFQPVERIVEPRENVLYAGRLLLRLHGEEGSWKSAVARYNGASTKRAQHYVCNVWSHLKELDPTSAKLLESSRCTDGDTPNIAPGTRRTFQKSQQVAALP